MKTNAQRARELAMIHIGAKQLGLSKDDGNEEKGILSSYHAMLWTTARVKSSADLDDYQRKQVILYLKKCGAKFIGQKGRRIVPALSKAELLGKIQAQLAEAKKPSEYADGIARNMYQIEKIEWCNEDQLKGVIAALYKNAKRKGLQTR